MSAEGAAVRAAIALYLTPSQVRAARQGPMADNIHFLMRIVAGDQEAIATATEIDGRPAHLIEKAACFYIEQILFAPDADSYRILGGDRSTSTAELRRNMALLLRWLHPDTTPSKDVAVYAARVIDAWETLKTPERRISYDDRMKLAIRDNPSKRAKRLRMSPRVTIPQHLQLNQPPRESLWRRLVSMVFEPRSDGK